jgi:hypothetical protein
MENPSFRCYATIRRLLGARADTDRCGNAKLGKVSADRIDHRSLLADEQMACAMEHQPALLLGRLVAQTVV